MVLCIQTLAYLTSLQCFYPSASLSSDLYHQVQFVSFYVKHLILSSALTLHLIYGVSYSCGGNYFFETFVL